MPYEHTTVSMLQLRRQLREHDQLMKATNEENIQRVADGRPLLETVAEDDEIKQLRAERPVKRSDCVDGPRPCPWTSCRHHLYLEANDSGTITLNFPKLEVHEMTDSCSLDIADDGPKTLEEVGLVLTVTRERIRQIEERAMRKLFEVRVLQLLLGDG